MIKAEELRIGNWVCEIWPEHESPRYVGDDCKRKESVLKVKSILPEGINSGEGHRNIMHFFDGNFSYIEGIPITPEWLERLGFVYKDGATDCGEERKNGVHLYVHDEDPGYFHYSLGGFNGIKVEIKYLHQLQNLYFALTGEELKIEVKECAALKGTEIVVISNGKAHYWPDIFDLKECKVLKLPDPEPRGEVIKIDYEPVDPLTMRIHARMVRI